MRRLLPEPAEDTTIDALVATLRPWENAPADRPRVLSNFVISLDGRTTVGGVSRPLGSDTDTSMLVALRTRVDAVMIGAATMRAERYGRVVGDPAKRARREEAGLSPDPLFAVVSGSLDLPWDAPLFSEEGGRVVIFTTSESDLPDTDVPIEVIRHEGGLDLAAALAYLRTEEGVRALLCEGGAHLHGALHQAGMVDEMFVTHAPKLVGGSGPGLVAGLPQELRALEIAWLVAEPDTCEVFARYKLAADG
ncbi:pyrimidine reductase family protein [soil metagenome]